MPELDISERLVHLAFSALDHGIESVRKSGGPLTPFLAYESEDGQEKAIERFVAETLEGSIEEARKRAATLASNIKYCALVYDGFLTMGGTKYDAILVEATERGKGMSFNFAQRYKPKSGKLNRFKTIDNPAFVGEGQPLF